MFGASFRNRGEDDSFVSKAAASGAQGNTEDEDDQRIAPTQRVSQVRVSVF